MLKGKVPNFVKSIDMSNDAHCKKDGRNQSLNNRYSKNAKNIDFSS